MNLSNKFQLNRQNQVNRSSERWQPPAYIRIQTPKDRIIAFLRRLLDLQAASVYGDLSELLPHTSGQLLDVGCGAQPYRHILPVDVTYQAIDHISAADQFQYQSEETTYFDGTSWPVSDQSFDFILSTETLEHVLQPEIFLSEAYRSLKPGGQLIMTVPFAARWHYIPHDYWRFTPSALEFLLTRAGFVEIRIYGRGNHVTVAAYKALALLLKLVFPHDPGKLRRAIALAALIICTPLLIGLAMIGQVTLRAKTGDDTLGYTVLATKPKG